MFVLVRLVGLSLVELYPVNAQSQSYFCHFHEGRYTTVNTNNAGILRPIIDWSNRRDRDSICNTVSRRFRIAKDNGNLELIVRDRSRVCGTTQRHGGCREFLFSTDTPDNAEFFRRNLDRQIIIRGDLITESNGREYFNLELYLQRSSASSSQNPIFSSQAVSEN